MIQRAPASSIIAVARPSESYSQVRKVRVRVGLLHHVVLGVVRERDARAVGVVDRGALEVDVVLVRRHEPARVRLGHEGVVRVVHVRRDLAKRVRGAREVVGRVPRLGGRVAERVGGRRRAVREVIRARRGRAAQRVRDLDRVAARVVRVCRDVAEARRSST